VDIAREVADQLAVAVQQARLHERVERHAAELERKVQERTKELEEANARLEEASRHKSEFLANMSHELRTPLNSILGFSEVLQQQTVGPTNPKQARYLGHIHQSGKHLLQLINDILDLAKVEAGKFVLQPEPLDVAATLEDILVIARGLANKKSQTIEAEIEPDLPPLQADPVRFKQICFNLLSNAIKFTPEQGRIAVAARRAPGAPDYLETRVTDTGIGIKPADLPRLFQEFVQLEAATSKRYEGTGLGLALTKRFVEMHGGRSWAESAGEGRGSTFTVVLPFGGPGGPSGASAVSPIIGTGVAPTGERV
jgi:signal transduction histidine kinase